MSEPYAYIYFDTDGVESLYAQTVDRLETEFVQTRERGGSGKITGKAGLGKLLSALLGVDIAAEAEASLLRKHIDAVKSSLAPEHKLHSLLSYLDKNEASFSRDLAQAAYAAIEGGPPVFVACTARFDMPQFRDSPDPVSIVNQVKAVLFEIGDPPALTGDRLPARDTYDHADQYFSRKAHPRIVMSASLNKFSRLSGFMGPISHDAIYFRACGGRDVPLNVFGYLVPFRQLFHQLKPYAIWL